MNKCSGTKENSPKKDITRWRVTELSVVTENIVSCQTNERERERELYHVYFSRSVKGPYIAG